jgi:arsenate reductase-like glutaredoxin family protein
MLAQPSMIKRPVLEADDKLVIGFSDQLYGSLYIGNA